MCPNHPGRHDRRRRVPGHRVQGKRPLERAHPAGRQVPRHNIVKAVCGFLNGEGGNLFIGVTDDGTVLGIGNDLATLESQATVDGYELFVRQLDSGLSTPTATTVRVRFPEISGNVVCQVSVAAAGRPVFARPVKGGNDATDFWVRVGNATKQLHGDDLLRYQEEHWG
ncbi:AlbA family DNA-binding domain-containing protein [Streptomyces sp. L7]